MQGTSGFGDVVSSHRACGACVLNPTYKLDVGVFFRSRDQISGSWPRGAGDLKSIRPPGAIQLPGIETIKRKTCAATFPLRRIPSSRS